MRYVGIDPSTKTGIVVIEDGEVIAGKEITSNFKIDPQRFMNLTHRVLFYLKPDDVICI